MSDSTTMTYGEALRVAMQVAMRQDPTVILYGLGVPDPHGVFGTTKNLHKEFGDRRVFDMPTAENGMTGIGIGAALTGLKPVLVSQRLDFYLLAMDQLVNNAAKWHYMFGGANKVPFTVRLILGRGWGQGPTHSQSLQSWFAHIPGLKVVMPTFPEDAKGLMLSAVMDPNPVVVLDHRWLHNTKGTVPFGDARTPIGKARVVRDGKDVTIVAMSLMTIEALRAAEFLAEQGVDAEVIDLRTIAPLDWDTVLSSVARTGRVLAVDTSHMTCSVSSEIVARASETCFAALKCAPRRLAQPDVPSPTSPALTKDYYPDATTIVRSIAEMMGKDIDPASLEAARTAPHDVPGNCFTGPF